jgi:hypothetical protein
MRTILSITMIYFFSILNCFDKKPIVKKETIITHHYYGNDKPYLSDSISKYFRNGKLIKTIKHAIGKKSRTETYYIVYDKNANILKKYTYHYYPSDTEPKNWINDSVEYKYDKQKVILKIDYLNKIDDKPKKTKFLYENGKLSKEFIDKKQYDSTSIDYKQTFIERKNYIRGELCYIEKIITFSLKDTLSKFEVNRANINCGFNSLKSYRRIYDTNNKLNLTIIEKSDNSQIYSFYKDGDLIKICNDSLQNNCNTTYEYKFDKYKNWTYQVEKVNGKIQRTKKRIINY